MVLQSCPVVSGPAGVCKQKGPTNVTSLSVGLVYFENLRLNQAVHAGILLGIQDVHFGTATATVCTCLSQYRSMTGYSATKGRSYQKKVVVRTVETTRFSWKTFVG